MRMWGLTVGLIIAYRFVSFADHELRQGIFDALGPTAWGMYMLLPIPFVALGIVGYLVYRAWQEPLDKTPPSLNSK